MINLNSIPLANSQIINNNLLPTGTNDSSSINEGFREFMNNTLIYFFRFVIVTALVLIIMLLCFSFQMSNNFIYLSWIFWSLANLANFLQLNRKSLPKQKIIFEILENSALIIIFVKQILTLK